MKPSWMVIPLVLSLSSLSWSALAAPGAGAPLPADREPGWQEGAEAYCRMVTGIADSESALLLSPRLFGMAGVFPTGGWTTEAGSQLGPYPRVTVGVSYSAAGVQRGLLLRGRARARCVHRRLEDQLDALVEANEAQVSRRALGARLRVIEAALPRAQEILQRTRAELAQARATLEELDAAELRVDRLRVEVEAARKGMALAVSAPAPGRPIAELLDALAASEAALERYDADLRRSNGWDVEVQGGYDQVIGATARVPVFGAVRTSLSLGMLFSSGADARTMEARRSLSRADSNGLRGRVRRLLRALRVAQRSEQIRLGETSALLADLEARLVSAEAVGGEKARRYAEYLWFEVVRVRAEHEYLSAHLKELSVVLGG